MVLSNTHNDEEVQSKVLDRSKFRQVKSKQVRKGSTEAGALSIINSENGKRITISEDLMAKLNNPQGLQFGLIDEGLAISENLGEEHLTFNIKKVGKKTVVYAAELVNELTEEFNLDYSNRTSITFHDVDFYEEEVPIAVIKLV